VQVGVGGVGHVVVDDDVHTLDVDSSTPNVGRNQNAVLEVLEGLVPAGPMVARHEKAQVIRELGRGENK